MTRVSWKLQKALPVALRVSAVLAPLLLARPVQAQLFNQFIPAEVYGTDEQPDVTVASRIHTGYDNGGIRAGNFIIRPQLTEAVGYETNVLGQPNPTGSTIVNTSGVVTARSDGSRGSVLAIVNVNNSEYLALPTQSYTSYSAQLGGTYVLGRDTASLTVAHDNEVQTSRDLDVPQFIAPLAVVVDRVRAGYRAVLNRLSLTPDIEVAHYTFDSGQAGGVIYDQSYRNRVVASPGITAAYEFATRRSVVLVLRDTVAAYSHGSVTNPKRDYSDAVVLGGVDYDLNGILRTRLLVGYERRTFTSSAYPTLQAPIAELTLIYNPTGLTTVTGTLARRIQDSADETTAGVTSLSGQLRVDHELRRNVILGGTGAITRLDYAAVGNSSASSQTLYTGGVAATYLINRYASASATYDLTIRSGGTNAVNLNGFMNGGNYTDHRFLLQIRLAL